MAGTSEGRGRPMSRREALRGVALLGGATFLGACTPARIVMGWYPRELKTDDAAVRRILTAMSAAVVPGVAASEEALAGPFYDERFPLHRVRAYLAADLCERASAAFGEPRFDRLDPNQRARVIESGLGAGGTTQKIYTGAVFLIQLALYSGFYEGSGCAEIEFEVPFRPVPLTGRTYGAPEEFLAREAGLAGNYA